MSSSDIPDLPGTPTPPSVKALRRILPEGAGVGFTNLSRRNPSTPDIEFKSSTPDLVDATTSFPPTPAVAAPPAPPGPPALPASPVIPTTIAVEETDDPSLDIYQKLTRQAQREKEAERAIGQEVFREVFAEAGIRAPLAPDAYQKLTLQAQRLAIQEAEEATAQAEADKMRGQEVFGEVKAEVGTAPLMDETHYVEVEKDPTTEKNMAVLHTTAAGLLEFRHMGFDLDGPPNTLTEKMVQELGQVIQRNFNDSKRDLDGKATLPPTHRAAMENELVGAAQMLLDKLFQVERFINAEDTYENREDFAQALKNYSREIEQLSHDPEHPGYRLLAGTLKEDRSLQVRLDLKIDGFSAKDKDGLAEMVKREATAIATTLNSINFLDPKKSAFSEQVGSHAKRAIVVAEKHKFPLTLRPSSGLISDFTQAESPNTTKVVPLTGSTIKNAVRVQRAATYINNGKPENTIAPLSKSESIPLLNPKLVWRRISSTLGPAVNNPTNSKEGLSSVRAVALNGLAVLRDNFRGIPAGIVKGNATGKRKARARTRFSEKPNQSINTGRAEYREWTLRRELDPTKTPLNKLSELAAEVVGKTGSAVVYTGKALADATIHLATDNALALAARRDSKETPETRILNMLNRLQEKSRSGSTMSPSSTPPLPSETLAAEPPDTYEGGDLLAFAADYVETVSSGLNRFVFENPTTALLLTTTFAMMAAPTPLHFALQAAIDKISLQSVSEELAKALPAGTTRDTAKTLILNYLVRQLDLVTGTGLSNLAVTKLSLQVPKALAKNSPINVDSLRGTPTLTPGLKGTPSLSRTPDLKGTPELKSGAYEVKSETPNEFEATTPVLLYSGEPLTSPHQTSESPQWGPQAYIDPIPLKLIECYDLLPSLSQMKKDDLIRNLLKKYPDHPEFTDVIIRQCDKTGPITFRGATLPQSALSGSLTQIVKGVTRTADLILTAPRAGVDMVRRKQSVAQKAVRARTRTYLQDSALKVSSAAGTIGHAVAKTIVTAGVRLPVGAADQLMTSSKAATTAVREGVREALKSPPQVFTEPMLRAQEEKTIKTAATRARRSAAIPNLLSKTSAGIKEKLGINRLQEKTHGRMTPLKVAAKVLQAEAVEAQAQASSASISPPKKIQNTSWKKPYRTKRSQIAIAPAENIPHSPAPMFSLLTVAEAKEPSVKAPKAIHAPTNLPPRRQAPVKGSTPFFNKATHAPNVSSPLAKGSKTKKQNQISPAPLGPSTTG